MRLDWAIPCMSVNLENGVALSIENACWDSLNVPELPHPIEFVAFARFVGLPGDFAEEADRTVEAYLLGPAMGQVVDISFELPSSEPPPALPAGWEMNWPMPILVQFTAEEAGPYGLDFYIGNKYQKASFTFRIEVAGPPD
jgi:hypothetical protein